MSGMLELDAALDLEAAVVDVDVDSELPCRRLAIL